MCQTLSKTARIWWFWGTVSSIFYELELASLVEPANVAEIPVNQPFKIIDQFVIIEGC
jgi:hypothetical protein